MQGDVGIERVFRGWRDMPLDSARDWLIDRFGDDMHDVVVALPGARSGRLLEEALAKQASPALRPPKIITAGALSDELLEADGTPAGRLTRTLAWAAALRELAPQDLLRIVARPPKDDDPSAWWRLAEEVRGLFGEVAAEGLQFDTVAKSQGLPSREGERKRWQALAAAQAKMEAQLENAGASDPHLGRLRAIDAGDAAKIGQVVLVGVVEMNQLLRRALELCKSDIHALVFAPDELAESFDAWGCLRTDFWSRRDVNLPLESWTVVDRPGDQGDAVLREIASWNNEYSAGEITVGLANSNVGPFVQRRLGEQDIVARDAAGTPLNSTGPMKLLEAMGRFLRTRHFRDFANLLRQPDFEAALHTREPKLEPVGVADAYYNAHLPEIVDGKWLAKGSSKRDLGLRKEMERVWEATLELLEPFWNDAPDELSDTIAALRNALETIYGDAPLDPGHEAQRIRLHSLQKIAEAFAEIESIPDPLAPAGGVHETLELLQRLVQNQLVPPHAARADETTIEMLGWLELPLDSAPALVIVGFEDGQVPESVRGDAFLPNSLRHDLGLTDDEARLARDLYATELLLHSRRRVAFISGRRSLDGDPQVPSRIVFHCEPSSVVERVKRFLGGNAARVAEIANPVQRTELPSRETDFHLEKMSVTDFRLYLQAPYEYYLKKVLGLDTLDDRARELDPRAFGNLAHDVLQRFGQDKRLRDERDPEKIARFLAGELQDLAREVYGERPLPAVRLQVEQLGHRLRGFAWAQAERRANGWEILAAEWEPKGGSVPFVVDGETIQLRGRIDRIDHDPVRKRFAIWDYKTGDALVRPANAHRRSDGSWKDLQLPLYCVLAAGLVGDEPPEQLGYAALCKKPNEIGFHSIKTWGAAKAEDSGYEEGIAAGYEAALEVVRAIRRGEFIKPDGFEPYDEIFRAIGGLGLVEALDSDDEEEAE